jgi:hypothetical protein
VKVIEDSRNEYFGDDVHLNATGLAAYRPLLQTPLKELIAASLSSHQKNSNDDSRRVWLY